MRDDGHLEDEFALTTEARAQGKEAIISPIKVPFVQNKQDGLLRARDLDCHKALVNPGRPKLLGQLLDGMNESLVQSDDKFKLFVAQAEQTTASVKACEVMDVKCTLKYNQPSTVEKEWVDTATNSMVFTFMFYAAMQQGGSTSFQATELANETLSYYELDKFCRDFDIVPKMLTKMEIKAIWMDFISMHAQTEGGVPLQALNFPQFQDYFVRMALYAYNKVGMKKMILSVTGFFPSAEEIIDAMCTHCKFNDFNACQRHIREVGRETQGALNFRSVGDNNQRARAEIRIDLRAKFLARAAKKEADDKDKADDAKEKRRKMRAGENIDAVEEEKQDVVTYGLWSSLSGKSYKKSRGMFEFTQKKGKGGKSNLPSDILNLLDGKDSDGNSLTGSHSRSHAESIAASSHEGSMAEGSLASVASEPEEELMTYDKSTALAKKKGTRLELITKQYSKELIKLLSKYSRTDPPPEPVGLIESDAAFMDCGYLRPNTVCSLIISITNLSLDLLYLNVSTDNVGNENTHVLISPKPLVSGMVRNVIVKFSVGDDIASCIGSCLVNAVSSTGLDHNLRVPMFYRADAMMTPRALLNRKMLPDMCIKYLGRAYNPYDSFQRKRSEDGVAWLRPQSGNTLRRSTQEMRPTSAKAKTAEAALRTNILLSASISARKLSAMTSPTKQSNKSLPPVNVPHHSSARSFSDVRPVSDRSQGSEKLGPKKNRPATAKA